jgi:hypothetical protein
MVGLSNIEITKIVYKYIGVSGGYLGDFSYRTHAIFYPEYCGLEINPNEYENLTTRERFIKILSESAPLNQAKILRGILERFPVNMENKPTTRTKELYDELLSLSVKIESGSIIPLINPTITSEVVWRTISDIETLLKNNDPVSCIDRIHTMLHGYFIAICDRKNLSYNEDEGITKLFKIIRDNHPIFSNTDQSNKEINRILQSFSSILDSLNTLRNRSSIAHPNKSFLGHDDAVLVINIAKTMMVYLDAKLT